MSERTFAARERALLGELAPLIADRAREEGESEDRLRDAQAEAERECRRAVAAAEARFDAERSALERGVAAQGEALRADHARARAAAERERESELAAFAERTNSIEASAVQDLEDSAWLAETVVESSERKVKQEFACAAKLVASTQADVVAFRAEADQLLARFGHPPLPAGDAHTTGSDAGTPAQRLDAAHRAAGHALRVLDARVNPALVRPSSFVIGVLLAGLLGPLAAAFLKPLNVELARAATVGAASAAGLAVVLFFVLRALLRRRVPKAAGDTSAAIARAEFESLRVQADAESERDRSLAQIRAKRDGELRKARDRHAALRSEVQHRRSVQEPEIRRGYDEEIESSRRACEARIRESEDDLKARVQQLDARRSDDASRAQERRDRECVGARQRHAREREALLRRWSDALARADDEHCALAAEARSICPEWGEAPLRPAPSVPQGVTLGTLEVDLASMTGGLPADPAWRQPSSRVWRLPAMLDLRGGGSLLIHAPPDGRAQAIKTLENTLLRLLTAFPPGKARFTIIDPVGLGQSFAGFMHLSDYEEALVGDKIWTDQRFIDQKLADLTEHMENVIQKYLRNEFATIQDYNTAAGEVAEPFRFLVIADFPAGISEAGAKRLASIVASGPRCGVYTLIATDARQRPPAYVPMSDLERASVNLVWNQGRYGLRDESLGAWPLVLEAPPADEKFTRLIHAIGRLAKDSSRVQVPFEIVAPPPPKRWSADASEELRIPIGRAGATKLQHLTLGRGTQQHALIAGRTGSGKSTLLHALITNLSLWYSPDEVEFYLVDFKKGVEFKTYATHEVPHARVVAVESEREFGLSVLRRLDAELTRRGQLFREAGVQDLASYRRWARGVGLASASGVSWPMPRTLLIVDEFQEFFVEDDKLAQEASLLLDRLVRQGRAFGVHVILGSQTVGGAYSLARSTIGQMAIRVALQCSEADSYLILSEENSAARLLSRPGEAIYNDASGLAEGNSPFQVVWLPDDKREMYLREVKTLLPAAKLNPPPPPVVFEGNVPADLSRNAWLFALARREGTPPALPRAWLGEAISIKEPTSVVLRRRSAANVLVLGQQERAALGVTTAALLSLSVHHAAARDGARFVVLDAGDADAEQTAALVEIARGLGAACRYGTARDADDLIAELSADLDARRADEHAEAPRTYLIIHGLQRFRSLRRSDGDFGFADENAPPTTPDRRFARLLRDGPALGMHTVAWCDTVANLERTIDRRAIREFDSRVLFQMSGTDSSALIDSPQAVNLGQHRALLYTEELGQAEKFRPYAVPDAALIAALLRGAPVNPAADAPSPSAP